MPSPTSRAATLADYPAFARLFPELGVPDEAPSEAVFRDRMLPRVVVACAGDAVVAYGFFQVYGATAHVVHVVTAPEARGAGAGRVVLGAIRERALAEGCARWYLNVKKGNAPALRLYARVGMAPEGEAVTMRAAWADLRDLPRDDAAIAFDPSPDEDAAIAERFGLDAARLGVLRGRGVKLAALREGADLVGFAAFDPALPGVPVLRLTRPALARRMLDALEPAAPSAHLILQVEDAPDLAAHLTATGAKILFEITRMSATFL